MLLLQLPPSGVWGWVLGSLVPSSLKLCTPDTYHIGSPYFQWSCNAVNDEGKTPLDLLELYEQKVLADEKDSGMVVPKDRLAGAMEAAKQFSMSLKDLLSADPKEDTERFKEVLVGVGGRCSLPPISNTPLYQCCVFKVKKDIDIFYKQVKDSISGNMDII